MTQRRTGGGPGARTGRATSRSLMYAREVKSPDQMPDEPGKVYVTTNHDVIRRWTEERGAVPAAVIGTEHPETGTLGVLTFDFPPIGDNDRLGQVSWDDWFNTFDRRELNFIFQQRLANGRQSNFFRLENPHREDA